MKQFEKKGKRWNYRIAGIVTVVFIVVSALGFHLTRGVLLQNAQNLGNELASRYAEMELQTVRTSELLLTVGVWAMEDHIDSGTDPEKLEQWTELFFQKVIHVSPTELVPYAVIDGTLITAEATSGTESTPNLKDMAWYSQAVQSDGETVVSSTGSGTNSSRGAIVIARKCRNSQNVMAFEIYLDEWKMESAFSTLPGECSYFLCNANGDLLYARTQLQVAPEQLQQYVQTIFRQIKAGNLDDAQEYIYDLVSEKRAVYFHTDEDGGVSIITIPYSLLLKDLSQVFYLFLSISCIAMLFLAFLSIREYRMQKKLSRINETAAALGNLYYSIYQVNWVNGTYETIKGSEDISRRIPPQGSYDQLLDIISQVIDQDTFNQFKTSFSLENMHSLVEKNVSDFGGDFRRLFGSEYRWVNVRLLFDASLQHNEAILCFRQVDAEKTQQLQHLHMLENALDRARESEAAQEKFFSQMSHDMRTPLGVIIATVELAQRSSEDSRKTADCLKKIQVSAGQLLGLINDILEMSRMGQTELHLKNDPCDLQETVKQCVSVFHAEAELQHKTLTVAFSLSHPQVYVDAFRLQQVLNNLLSNALKFTAQGDTIEVEVSQPPRQDHGMCRIVVRDTGIGMSEEFLPQLFTPYARESRFGTQTVLGTGLGMAIVKTIVSRMEGQIQVESAPGKGTTITLTIPMEPVADAAPPAVSPTADPMEILYGKHILLVDDFEMNLEIGTELLKLCGALVTQARNGLEAVETFRASKPGFFDVILMDMKMPVMDGCEAAQAIRAMDRADAAAVPILAVTANAFAEDMAATAQAGMNAHIAKPVDLKQLAAALRDLEKS